MHLVALALGIASVIAAFALPGGLAAYLVSTVVSLIAVAFGHRAVERPGDQRWAAITGMVLSYLMLLLSLGLLIVRLTRIFMGI